jgi:signal transduction histidine kinase
MTAQHASLATRLQALRRWWAAAGFAVAILIFVIAHSFARGSTSAVNAVNDFGWGIASLIASIACLFTALRLAGREKLAWILLTLACFAWCVGQVVWTIYEVGIGQLPEFPHWVQVFFMTYHWLFFAGLLWLPKTAGAHAFTPRHGGNLLLIVCALMVAFIIALTEPAQLPQRKTSLNLLVFLQATGLASMFIAALYLLWSFRWQALYWSLVLFVAGAGIHTATYIAYIHQLMTETYTGNDWYTVSWLLVFGCFACAAYERHWQIEHQEGSLNNAIAHRDRWLEALIPAMLIAIMLGVAWTYSAWLSPRVAAWATSVGLAFAAVLGLREAWIQRQEQRLLSTLSGVNDEILATNRELSKSEFRYRSLSSELEQRVAERTRELQQAYRELENFSYAAAHDLKAPLRSVDGFGSMLATEYGDRLDEKGRGYLQRMRRSALKMSELIDDLLAYARVERREFEASSVFVPAILEKVIAEQREDMELAGVQLQTDFAPFSVHADTEGLLMACRNLLQNSIKFSRQSQPPKIVIAVTEHDGGVCISFTDNGIGFDMSYHERIFEMFQRLHRAEEIPGTGIGLAIVRKAVERMGGRVWAKSAPGTGATFYLQLQPANANVQAMSR